MKAATYFKLAIATFVLGLSMIVGKAFAEPVYVKNCSGTYIGNGYVLTAGHCTDQTELFVAKTNPAHDVEEGATEKYTVKVVWSAGARDVGILKLDKAVVKTSKEERDDGKDKTKEAPLKDIPFKTSKVACEQPKIGDKLTMKGWPIGEYVEVSGYVAGTPHKVMHRDGYWEMAQFVVLPGTGGNSGSGVMNEKDEVIAILVGSATGSGLMVIVPMSEVCNILPR